MTMGLVGYSDSEDSDVEDQNPKIPLVKAQPNGAQPSASKPAFQKVVDRSNPHKIRVTLPSSSDVDGNGTDELDAEAPPAKKARTGGAFSGFNSMLPAPTKTNATASTTTASPGGSRLGRLGRAPGAGVSLKTGAAPSFSREPEPKREVANNYGGGDFDSHTGSEGSFHSSLDPAQVKEAEEPKLVGKATIFKPLSVSRKPAKKKKAPLDAETSAALKSTTTTTGTPAQKPEAVVMPKEQMQKQRKSLFSSYEDDVAIPDPTDALSISLPEENAGPADPPLSEPTTQSSAPTQSLSSLAASLDLTPSQRRQLFGRNAKDMNQFADAQVSHFSLATEYSNNNALRENESTAPGHKPVRSIAGGKHSLQQLVNMASNQKDALEESFASGKANKKAAGSKYGW